MAKLTIEAKTEEELEEMLEVANMDMPCLCDCGRWFDLHLGIRNWDDYNDNNIYCGKCDK